MIVTKEKMILQVETIRRHQRYYGEATVLVTATGIDGEEVAFLAKPHEWQVGDTVDVEIVKRVDKP